MDYRILSEKPEINIPDSSGNKTKCIDLLTKTYNPNGMSFSFRTLIVNKYYVARPDLISFALYRTDEYADIICKLNGISNPIELNENDIIIVPYYEDLQNMITKGAVASNIKSDDDDNIIETQASKRKALNDVRSPGRQTVNDYNYVIDKSLNLVFY